MTLSPSQLNNNLLNLSDVTDMESTANSVFVYDTAGEQWASPTPGNGFYNIGRSGKHYYNGSECGPTLNGTSFCSDGVYNGKTWMTDIEPSGLAAGTTNPVMSIVSDDHVKFNTTSPINGYPAKFLSSRFRWCLIGNFDIQISYVNLSKSGGVDGSVPMFLAEVDDLNWCYVRRHYDNLYESDILTNNTWGSYASASTTDTYGKLRLVRSGGQTITTYYWNNSTSAWVTLRTATDRGAVMSKPMRIDVYVGGDGNFVINRVDIFGFTINSGTVNNTSGWFREAADPLFRSTRADFPEKVVITAYTNRVDIVDYSTNLLWMRFLVNIGSAIEVEPKHAIMKNGVLLVATISHGTIEIDFTTDSIRKHTTSASATTGAFLKAWNGVYFANASASARDCGPVGIIASRNRTDGGYSGDWNQWQIPSANVRHAFVHYSGEYIYKIHATTAGIGVTKWRRWYNNGATGQNWWSPIYFSSVDTSDMFWCFVDPADETLYYVTSAMVAYSVPATWKDTANAGTFSGTLYTGTIDYGTTKTYVGKAGKYLAVNSAATKVELATVTIPPNPFPGDDPPSSPSIYDDEFDGSSINPKWSWLFGGAPTSGVESAVVGSGRLQISFAPDSGVFANFWTEAHVLAQPAPDQSFTIVSRLNCLFKPSYPTISGLFIGTATSDPNGFIISGCSCPWAQSSGQQMAAGMKYINAGVEVTLMGQSVAMNGIWLKITWNKSTTKFRGWVSPDGVVWVPTSDGSTNSNGLTTITRFGLCFWAYSNIVGQHVDRSIASVDYFRVIL